MNVGNRKMVAMVGILISCILTACTNRASTGETGSSIGSKEAQSTDAKERVTLKVFPDVVVTDDDFKKIFYEPVVKKYPNIQLELIKKGTGNMLQDLITSGNTPDLILSWQGGVPNYKTLDLVEDITPLLKQQNIDLNRFDPVIIDAMKATSDKGELYGLPYGVNFNALYYNKDIFDKFGVPYPKDGMTWEDAMEVAKKVSRQEGGVNYRGLHPEDVNRMALPLTPHMSDPSTDRSLLNSDKWKRVFEITKSIFSIPGNERDSVPPRDAFIKNKNVAMLATVNIFNTLGDATSQGLNWDVAQYPSYKELPDTYGAVDAHWMIPVKTSKPKSDALMKVMQTVTSEEAQMIAAKQTGRLTPLTSDEIKKAFAADLPYAKDKHLQSIFKSKPAPYPKPPRYVGNGAKHRNDAFNQYVAGNKDLNTALREAEEKHNKDIMAEKK